MTLYYKKYYLHFIRTGNLRYIFSFQLFPDFHTFFFHSRSACNGNSKPFPMLVFIGKHQQHKLSPNTSIKLSLLPKSNERLGYLNCGSLSASNVVWFFNISDMWYVNSDPMSIATQNPAITLKFKRNK